MVLLGSDDEQDGYNFDIPDQETDQAGCADADDDLGAEHAADADEDEDGVGDDDNECYSRKDKKLWLQGVLVCWTADAASSDRYPIADLKHGKSEELAGRSMYALYRDLTPRALAVPLLPRCRCCQCLRLACLRREPMRKPRRAKVH